MPTEKSFCLSLCVLILAYRRPSTIMFDYVQLLSSSLWILGLALILAALSMAYYQASLRSQKTRQIIKQPGYRLAIFIGFILFCLGIALGDSRLLFRLFWGVLIALATFIYFEQKRKLISGRSEDVGKSE